MTCRCSGSSGPAEVIATRTFNVAFAVDYSGPAEALEPLVTITAGNLTRQSLTAGLPAVCEYWQSSPMTCRFGRFQPGSGRVEFSAEFVAPQGGPAYVDVEVTSLNDYTPCEQSLSLRVQRGARADAGSCSAHAGAHRGARPGAYHGARCRSRARSRSRGDTFVRRE